MSMSFLPLDELEPTLTDVLAFIDTFNSDGNTSIAVSSNSSNSSTCSSSDDGQASPSFNKPTTQVKKNTTQNRKTRKAAASRRCQQKKRAELLALRAQTAALEARLKELKQGAATGFISQGNDTLSKRLDKTQQQTVVQLWIHKAQIEKQLKLQSEAKNRELKVVVGRQSSMAETVRNLLGNVTNVVKIEEALRTPSPAGAGFEGFVPNLNDAIYIDLASNLGKLYMDASTVLAPQDMTEMEEVPNTLEIRRDASGMPYVEFRTTIYAGLELREAAKTIWSVKGCHYNKYRKYMTDLGMKKETEMELRDQSMAMAVSTMSLARSYEEDDRSLVTFNSLVSNQLMGGAAKFREQGWVMVLRSPSNPQSASVIQASYRLSPDAESLPFPYGSTSNIDATNVFVLQNLGAVMQANMRSIRATFLDAQPQPNPGRIPATC